MPVTVQILNSPDYRKDIARGAELLAAGKLLVLPTETVYGVAGVLTHDAARSALRELRPASDHHPAVIHLRRREDAQQYLGDVSELGRRLMKKVWPGPVGLMFDVGEHRRREVARRLGVPESEIYFDSAITLRCPDHPVFRDVISRIEQPVALTSAGAGQRRADVDDNLATRVEMVFDAGETRFSKPSTLLAVKGDKYRIVREGVYDERIIERLLRTTILFVCSGNTCRSPMAEAIARAFLAEKLKVAPDQLECKGIYVISAGAYATPGMKATPQAIETVKELGADLSHHRARPLTVELIHEADAVFAMSRSHVAAITAMVPSAADKVSALDPDKDVEDPIGGDISLYRDVAVQIKGLIERRLNEIV